MKIRHTIAASAIALATFGLGTANATNLITNGDFSLGNVDFTTGYNYVAPTANALYPEGDYTIGTNPIDVHDLWVNAPSNPTMMLVNGYAGSGPQPAIWEEDGIGGTGTYTFSATVQNLCCNASFGSSSNAPSEISFQYSNDGSTWNNILTYTTSPGTVAPEPDDGILVNISANFTDAGTFDIRAIDGDTAAGGNDFGLTNLSVTSAVPEPATWAMFLLGFGAIGWTLRSRRNASAETA